MIVAFFTSAIQMSIVFLFGCLGEILIERAGNLNLGIPGIMCMGALGGVIGVNLYVSLWGIENIVYILFIGFVLLCTLITSALGGLIYAFFTVTLKANQNVTGLVLTTFGVGLMKFIGGFLNTDCLSATKQYIRYTIIPYKQMGWFGNIFLSHGILIYLALIIAITMFLVIRNTRVGLNIRAIGESPACADGQGINVNKYKYLCILIGASIAGLGGLYFVNDYSGGSTFCDASIDAFGWLSLALVIFSLWNPLIGVLGAFIFGGLTILPNYLNISITQIKLFAMFPYLFTIIVLIVTSIFGKRNVQPPASLGVNYYRENR